MSKFKINDRVVRINEPFDHINRNATGIENGIGLIGTVIEIAHDRIIVVWDKDRSKTQTKNFERNLELYAVYNTPLVKALSEE